LHMDADQNLLTGSSQDRALSIQGFLAGTAPTFTGD